MIVVSLWVPFWTTFVTFLRVLETLKNATSPMRNHCFSVSRGKVFHHFSTHFPRQVLESLGEKFGSTEDALNAIVNQLNSEEIDLWAKAWAANNNVNNYEIETLPFPPLNGATTFSIMGKEGRV